MSLFDDVKNNLMEWYTISSDKTTEVARITTRRYDKFGISRDIERQFGELGSLIFNGIKEERQDLLTDPAVCELIERIKGLENELGKKNEEIDEIQAEFSQRRAQAAAAAAAATAAAAAAAEASSANLTETIITQPVLDEGADVSAILVEPVVVDVDENGDEEITVVEIVEEIDPEKEG